VGGERGEENVGESLHVGGRSGRQLSVC
jgi:hypothetical protein